MNALRRTTHTDKDIDPDGYVEGFAAAAERFAVAVGWSDLRGRVSTCPGWSVHDLVVHLGNVYAWAATIVETGRRAVEQNDEPSASKPREVAEWYAAKAEDLHQVLAHTDPDRQCWNFAFGDGVAGFWRRRQLHETTVHHLDLDLASGRATPVEPAVAADGVGEVLGAMMTRMHARGHPAAVSAPLALAATDTGDSWLVAPAGERGTAVPDVAHHVDPVDVRDVRDRVEGTAETLYRALWRRPLLEDLRISGDATRVRDFLASRLTP